MPLSLIHIYGYNYDAIYVPTDQEVANNEFRFVSADDQARFMDYVHADNYLKNQQGKYAEPYSVYSPWVHRIDFSYKHDFVVNAGNTKNKLQLSFDIKNVMNLFNNSWGVAKYLNPEIGSEARILKYEGVDADGVATYLSLIHIYITRLSPYGGSGMSFVGTDGRTANFTVDGANFNNNFGLSSALPGGGNPISRCV